MIAVSVNKADSALSLFKTAIEANPRIEQFWLSYIDALVKNNQLNDARRVIEEAEERGIDAEKLEALLLQSKITAGIHAPSQAQINNLLEYYQNGRFSDVEELALSTTRQFPKHQFFRKVLGALLRQSGRNSEGVNANQTAVALSPQDAEAL